ncbi:SCP-like protein, partial [Ostertagia ostertagi]
STKNGYISDYEKNYCEVRLPSNLLIPAPTQCPGTPFSKIFRDTALTMHNNFRAYVAMGRARNGYSGSFAPQATLMYSLKYSCDAERYAYYHVLTCDRQLSPVASRPGWKENYYIYYNTYVDNMGALTAAISKWQTQLAYNGLPQDMIFRRYMRQAKTRIVRKMTKMIWARNQQVGCAANYCGSFYFISCMYQDFVNTIDESIYTPGVACDACPAGKDKCLAASGLCPW